MASKLALALICSFISLQTYALSCRSTFDSGTKDFYGYEAPTQFTDRIAKELNNSGFVGTKRKQYLERYRRWIQSNNTPEMKRELDWVGQVESDNTRPAQVSDRICEAVEKIDSSLQQGVRNQALIELAKRENSTINPKELTFIFNQLDHNHTGLFIFGQLGRMYKAYLDSNYQRLNVDQFLYAVTEASPGSLTSNAYNNKMIETYFRAKLSSLTTDEFKRLLSGLKTTVFVVLAHPDFGSLEVKQNMTTNSLEHVKLRMLIEWQKLENIEARVRRSNPQQFR